MSAVQSAPSLSQFFSRHIKPDHNVAFIGAFGDPVVHDPSALYASIITSRGNGRVHIVDSQSQTLQDLLFKARFKHYTKNLEHAHERLSSLPFSGIGDPLQYRKKTKEFADSHGFDIRFPNVRIADAVDTRFKDKFLDVLVDAGSLAFVTDDSREEDVSSRSTARLQEALDEYKRISRKALFLYFGNDSRFPLIREILEGMGARVTETRISNEYQLSSPTGGKIVLKHTYEYDRAMVVRF